MHGAGRASRPASRRAPRSSRLSVGKEAWLPRTCSSCPFLFPGDLAPAWLALMQELRVEIARRRHRDGLEHLTDVAPVISAVGDDVKQDLFPGHAPPITV